MRAKQLRRIAAVAATGVAVLSLGVAAAGAEPAHIALPYGFAQQPTTAQCEAMTYPIACYSAGQIRRAYGVDQLGREGLTGRGETIVLVDSYGSPTLQHDLAVFDRANGLPAPPSLDIIQPAGPVPAWNPSVYPDQPNWAVETTLDVEFSHAMAPGANLIEVETPVDETEGLQGLPQMMYAEKYVIDNHLADVISQSFGATEQTFQDANGNFDPSQIYGLRYAYEDALAHNVTVLGATGDAGASDYELNLSDFYPFRVVDWPGSDPLVTAVGGLQLHLDAFGNRFAPDNVWNDTYNPNVVGPTPAPAAGSGGISSVFSRPDYQDGVRYVVGGARGIPDVSMSAAVNGAVNVFNTIPGVPGPWLPVGGTSEATPLFSGEVALADQFAGHDLGLLNPTLYRMGDGPGSGLTDVYLGDNTVTFTNSNGVTYTVHGYHATPGYDLASGLGTANPLLPFELAGGRFGYRR